MPLRRRGLQARLDPRRRALVPPPRCAPARRASAHTSRHEPFERLVERALTGLPEPIRHLLRSVAVVIEEEPSKEQLGTAELGADETLYGLYEGTPAVEYGSDWVPFPNKISLFRLPLEEDFPDPDELADEVRRTVVHELAHHAGISDERLHSLGYD